MTVAGNVNAALLLERARITSAADFDILTVHVALEPPVSLVTGQVSDDRTGVDHSVKLAVFDDVSSVAVIELVASAEMLPIMALKVAEEFAAGTTTLPGTVINGDAELRVTAVSAATGCERVAVHEVVAPDITPLGLHDNDVTRVDATNVIATDLVEPPYEAVTEPL